MGTRRITVGERRARLARRHRLVPPTRTDDVAAIADAVVALHSSDPASVFLSALARMRHPSISAVEAAARCDIPVVVTYHPAYLLRNLPDKAKAWEDLCRARALMRQMTKEQASAPG